MTTDPNKQEFNNPFKELLNSLTDEFPCDFKVVKEGSEMILYFVKNGLVIKKNGQWEYKKNN